MTDYKKIADGDPGGDLQTAYLSMKGQADPGVKTLTGNELRIWAAMNDADYNNLKAAAANSVAAEMAVALIQNPDSILEMEKQEVVALITGLNQSGVISDTGKAALENMAAVTTPKYPGLTQQTVLAKARTMRQEGRV